MYERNDIAGMATGCEQPHELLTLRQPQRPEACRSVGAGGGEHGRGLADSAQPSAAQEQRESVASPDVAGLRQAGSGNRDLQEKPCPQKRLVSLGLAARVRREPVHPQEGSALGEPSPPHGPVSIDTVLRLLEFQNFRCALTGRPLTPQTAALDHIVPTRFGGRHVIENTQVLHKDTNRAKGSLTSDEFIQLCREVIIHTARNN